MQNQSRANDRAYRQPSCLPLPSPYLGMFVVPYLWRMQQGRRKQKRLALDGGLRIGERRHRLVALDQPRFLIVNHSAAVDRVDFCNIAPAEHVTAVVMLVILIVLGLIFLITVNGQLGRKDEALFLRKGL